MRPSGETAYAAGGDEFVEGDPQEWADAMEYIETKFMPLIMRSPKHGGKSPANYFPDLVVGDPSWFRVQLLLFKPHQAIYGGAQPLLMPNQTAEEACMASGILCPACICPTKKHFQHGCEAKACQVQKYVNLLGLVNLFALTGAVLSFLVWGAFFSDAGFSVPNTAFELLTVMLLALSYRRASTFLEIPVGDPVPDASNWVGTAWLREKLILDSPRERFVTRKQQFRHVVLQAVWHSVACVFFNSPLGLPNYIRVGVYASLWSLLSLQYFISL